MHRDRLTNCLAAFLASSVVSFDSCFSGNSPAFAPVGCWAADPHRRLVPGHFVSHKNGMAFLGTEAITGGAFVLSGNPRLNLERLTALCALVKCSLNGVDLARLFTGKCVTWSKSSAPSVSGLVFVGHRPNRHMPLATTNETAKSGRVRSIWFYLKRCAAYLASFCDHDAIIPQFMGFGIIGIAAIAQRRIAEAQLQPPLFPHEPQPQAQQLPLDTAHQS